MNKIIHLCLSIRGVLHNYKSDRKMERVFKGTITTDEGKILEKADEIREFFYDQLAQGHEVLPIGKCDNFDYKTGCKGHVKSETKMELEEKPNEKV